MLGTQVSCYVGVRIHIFLRVFSLIILKGCSPGAQGERLPRTDPEQNSMASVVATDCKTPNPCPAYPEQAECRAGQWWHIDRQKMWEKAIDLHLGVWCTGHFVGVSPDTNLAI
eukprot:TRINITY_DN30035_c0_g1_i1.p2 TRINITY_DN30035_c0_g1~~TRINITY_DN30035_c0_g1_i1.p2  ORF type:complete len:113 (-),score=6.78 TRINITY_DN30035_c0_g1_i1:252-590(-)